MAFNSASTITVGPNPAKVVLTRQATFPLWAENTIAQTAVATANFTFGGVATWSCVGSGSFAGATFHPAGLAEAKGFTPVTAFSPGVVKAAGSTDYGSPFPAPTLGVDDAIDQIPFVYIPAGTSTSWVFGTSAAAVTATTYAVQLQKWLGPGKTDLAGETGATIPVGNWAGSSPVTSLSQGWYRPAVVDVDANVTPVLGNYNISVVIASSTMTYVPSATNRGLFNVAVAPTGNQTFLLPIAWPVEFLNSTLPWRSARTTASASLFTNTTKALNKEGTALWARVAPQVTDPFNVTEAELNKTHPAEKRFMGLQDGCYSYVAPTTDLQDFRDYTIIGDDNLTYPIYRLDNTALVNVCYFRDPDGGTSLAVNTDWHIEFRTTSSLFQIAMSPVPLESLHQAQIALAQAGFFYPNVTHAAVLSALAGAWRYLAPYVVSGGRGVARKFLEMTAPITAAPPPPVQATTIVGARAPRPRARRARSRTPRKSKARMTKPAPKKAPGKNRSGLDIYLQSVGRKR